MMNNSYGLCFSILANHSTSCSRLFKVSSLWRISQLQKQVTPSSVLKSISSFSACSWNQERSSKIFHCDPPSAFLPVLANDSAVLFSGVASKLLRMNPAKRPVEGGNSPPSKYRLLHCTAAKSDVELCQNSLVSDNDMVPNCDENEDKNVENPTIISNVNKKKISIGKKIRYEKVKEYQMQVKKSLEEFDELIQKEGFLEEMNSEETTFGVRETVVSGDAAATVSWNIDPQPIDAMEEKDLTDGMLNPKRKKKMFAVMLSYSGKGFLGLQNNPPHRTIEGELLKVMQAKDLLTDTECLRLQIVNFQRAARTDKGVSAAKQVISVRLPISDGEEGKVMEDLNALLLPQIRIMDIRRATRSFNSKNWCDCRTYSYLAPSFAFAPLDQVTSPEFRISETGLAELRGLMAKYLGTRNFHNFTIRKKPTDANAKRFIQLVEVDDPFVREGVEWILFKIRGQSFMMHQIRKMIGLVMSICRGLTPVSVLDESFTHAKIETPKAPGLGLVLEQPHYDIYNKRFGQDGTHKPIDWSGLEDKVAQFRRDYIDQDIITTELQEKSMLEFLKILHMYSFTDDAPGSGIGRAHRLLTNTRFEGEDLEDDQLPADEDDEDTNGTVRSRGKNSVASVNNTASDSKNASDVSKDNRSIELSSNGNHESAADVVVDKLDVTASHAEESGSAVPDTSAAADISAHPASNLDATSRQNS
ncbi:Pseudouridine synthase I TruA [Trinorchestia longiramus]|nr:Pseudouridine synthase I TruA [Trinorchestia longiramus]